LFDRLFIEMRKSAKNKHVAGTRLLKTLSFKTPKPHVSVNFTDGKPNLSPSTPNHSWQ